MKYIRMIIIVFILMAIGGMVGNILRQCYLEKKAFRAARVLCDISSSPEANEEAETFFQENKGLFISALIKIAKDKKQKLGLRTIAILLLGENRDNKAVAPLCELLSDDIWEIRAFSSEALGKIQDKESTEKLSRAWLNENSKKVREEIAVALIKIGDKRAIPSFLKTLKDTDVDIQMLSALALYKLSGKSDYLDIIIKATNDEKYEIRGKATAIMGRMISEGLEDQTIVSLVKKALNDKDPRLRKIAKMFINKNKIQLHSDM
jgi:HEAT repeat protein